MSGTGADALAPPAATGTKPPVGSWRHAALVGQARLSRRPILVAQKSAYGR